MAERMARPTGRVRKAEPISAQKRDKWRAKNATSGVQKMRQVTCEMRQVTCELFATR